ncbi:PREDICTED: haloacid dehalogenase-like hydrolase domain-containing protein 3 [Cyprinodon variegatus]|uniref:Haloacid dehalogenase-like hydrolase domain-containing protein 3 n=1 Tax=Cyprinodon variegatus TaxID=28743 RepID=A0A3Q2FQP1_CYPVA|nr:PREDICTED: haloacid dehalogenase-like hydrolase domain-containing protein 3 [Cyprinodon variegatus]XP_015256487.1 PREDICTED: haloacid dehalogenase-like hydrolase domain-containing protein 3 [Cyprinodon variegatus]
MRGSPLRWVLWDVKDTLLKVRGSVGLLYSKEAEEWGLSLQPAEVNAAFRETYRRYSSRYMNYGISQGLNAQTWWTGVVRDTLSQCGVKDPALANTMATKLYHDFCNAENWEVFPDSQTVLARCSSLGLKLGVVSNFDNRLEEILRSCGLLSHFSFVVTSEGAGVAKPNPAIFHQALQKCGTSADRVAHIGDHYEYDYLASRSVGIHGFLLDRDNTHKDKGDVPQEHRIVSLDDLPLRLQEHLA